MGRSNRNRGMKRKRMISAMMALLMAATVFTIPVHGTEAADEVGVSTAGYGIDDPVIDPETGTVRWDCVYLGSYPQTYTGSKYCNDSIKWRVLEVDGDQALLLADKNLDRAQFYPTLGDITWEKSTLRRWLNGYGSGYAEDNFIDTAFTAEEQAAMITRAIKNENNPFYGKGGGADTEDPVFLLSISEASNPDYGFAGDYDYSDTRVAEDTAYKAHQEGRAAGTTSWWWLRTPSVTAWSRIQYEGLSRTNYISVRPAIYLDLTSSLWSNAGTVSAGGWRECDGTPWPEEESFLKEPTMDAEGMTTWDCVYFGSYPQSSDGKGGFISEPIKWRVLSVDGTEALVLADKTLDVKKFNESYYRIRWEYCTLRSWLNGYDAAYNDEMIDYTADNFIDTAFSEEEQKSIIEKTIPNKGDTYYNVEDGNDTTDRIFLPSLEDVINLAYGFTDDYNTNINRCSRPTDYVTNIYKSDNITGGAASGGNAEWRLRSPGHNNSVDYAASVRQDGGVEHNGFNKDQPIVCGVRPMMYVNLLTAQWDYAGRMYAGSIYDEIDDDVVSDDSQSNPEAEEPSVEEPPVEEPDTEEPPAEEPDTEEPSVDHSQSTLAPTEDPKTETPKEESPTTDKKKKQSIICNSQYKKTYGCSPFTIDAEAKTELSYKCSNPEIVGVSDEGKITLKSPGKAVITITAAENENYEGAQKKVTVTAKLKKPVLKVKSSRGGKIKLTWSKVPGATGYKVYIYDPEKKKYVCRLTKKAKVKSVTHQGLRAGTVVKYKVRAYRSVGRKKMFSSYSAVKKAKARR